jgi:transposase
MEQVMGGKLLIDYAGDRLLLTDRETGTTRAEELFIAILAGSGYSYVEASESQQKASFLNSVRRTLEFIGGVSKLIVTDNLKSAVTQCKLTQLILVNLAARIYSVRSVYYNGT